MLSFVRRKFNSLLAVATLTMSVNYIVMLSGSVIVGNLVGADGLAGVNVCTPVFGIVSFLAALLSVGTALTFSRAMGTFDENHAARIVTQSGILAVLLALVIAGSLPLLETWFLDLAGVTGSIRLEAAHYWKYQTLAMALTPLVLLAEALVYADGDGSVAALAGLVHVIGSVGLSALFAKITGHAGGAPLGTTLAMTGVLAVCALHGFRESNHLRPHLPIAFSWSDFREMLAASLADSTIYLCWGVLVLIVNLFTVSRFGQGSLPLVALAASVVEFSIVFDGVGEALIPLGGMYDGEGNKPALRELANHAALMATAEGIVFGILFFSFAPILAAWYGIRGEAASLLPEATTLIRTLACAMPFMGLLMMVNTHFLVVRHIPLAVAVTVVKDFACPTIGALSLGSLLGIHGLWIGFAVGYAIAALFPFVTVRLVYGARLFPWLIEPDDGNSVNFSCRVGGRTVEFFVERRADSSLRLIVRTEGTELPPVDVREATSVRTLNTLGCNRTEYIFKGKEP